MTTSGASRGRPQGSVVAAVGVVVWALVALCGCAGTELGAQARGIRGLIKIARDNGAYRCAPTELALAETHVEFGDRELDQGDYFRARDHLRISEDNAREAIRLSPRDRCTQKPLPPRPQDGDGDGILDKDDKCPAEPEDKDGFEDADGCPDPDNDKDGILDAKDRCPTEPEDADGYQDDDGCPDPDNDQDGIADKDDKCPNEKEDRDGFEDADGCPDPDNDKDGVLDATDKCPNEPGPAAEGGCPQKFNLINITSDKIEIRQTILFATGKATILAKSYPLLDEVVTALRSRPSMRLRIEGHTDGRGARAMNVRLSQARADSVKAYLAGHSIPIDRLESRGYGPDQPIETNKTAAGRDRNRRVEFMITQP